MNIWSGLTTELRSRPGDPHPPIPKKAKPIKAPKVLTAAEQRQQEQRARRPNADLPKIENQWGLSPVQCAVMAGIADGKENGAIARQLGIATKTVETHVQRAKEHMGGVTRARAAVLWDRFIRGDNYGEAA